MRKVREEEKESKRLRHLVRGITELEQATKREILRRLDEKERLWVCVCEQARDIAIDVWTCQREH